MMLAFQQYQLAFTAHIRDPKNNPKPPRVNDKRMAIYREIVFNNMMASVSACFPVCSQIVGKRKWRKLCRDFFAKHQSTSPFFKDIPEAFLTYIHQASLVDFDLPTFFLQLAHYEWAELAVSNLKKMSLKLNPKTDLLSEKPILTSAHKLLNYHFPVHAISKRNQPIVETPTYILMFRNNADKVEFIELNAITHALLELIKTNQHTGQQALLAIAQQMNHPNPKAVIGFGTTILQDLYAKNAIIGSQ
jgi:uncharacterized protein